MHRLTFSPLFVLACMTASACTDQDTTIWITQVSAPSFQDGVCTSSGEPLTDASWSGTGSYAVFLTIANAIRSNATDIANDSNWVQIEGIEVTLTDSSGGAIGSYSVPVGGTIPSSGGAGELSEASVHATIIPAGTAVPIGYVVATIIPFGQTLGGLDVEGPPFSWPIQITGAAECFVCPADADAFDQCASGQGGSCTVLSSTDPACATVVP